MSCGPSSVVIGQWAQQGSAGILIRRRVWGRQARIVFAQLPTFSRGAWPNVEHGGVGFMMLFRHTGTNPVLTSLRRLTTRRGDE